MAGIKYTGAGVVADSDYKYVKFVGKTKSGKAVTIELPNAINLENIDLSLAEKDDVVPELSFEGCYEENTGDDFNTAEVWSITYADKSAAAAGDVMLGLGKFYVGTSASDAKCVGLVRGGGSFNVEREFRNITADGDRGTVKGRVVMEGSKATIKFKALQFIDKLDTLYAGINKTNVD